MTSRFFTTLKVSSNSIKSGHFFNAAIMTVCKAEICLKVIVDREKLCS